MNEIEYIGRINAQIIMYQGAQRIALQFDWCMEVESIIRYLPDSQFSKRLGQWHLPNTVSSQKSLRATPLQIVWTSNAGSQNHRIQASAPLTNEWLERLEDFENYLNRKRYRKLTITSYLGSLTTFLSWMQSKGLSELKDDVVMRFNAEYILERNLSRSYQNVLISALKSFTERFSEFVLDAELLERPRPARTLPNVLSEEDIQDLIRSYKNLKHKSIILMMYSCGLRKSELLHLKLTDIDRKRMVVRIRDSKGAKDRDVHLPDSLLNILIDYYREYRPRHYLFEGQRGGLYSPKSIDMILRKGLRKIGKPRRITSHGLRHSYATHLVERNVNLRFIQESLGHKSSKTTEIYTRLSKDHIARMVSPIDFWKEDDQLK